jgi:hypothetical protein
MLEQVRAFIRALDNDALVASCSEVVRRDCRTTAELLAHIAEIDRRKLWAKAACSSMFAMCVERFGMSEPMAQERRPHNQYEAEVDYGRAFMEAKKREADVVREDVDTHPRRWTRGCVDASGEPR